MKSKHPELTRLAYSALAAIQRYEAEKEAKTQENKEETPKTVKSRNRENVNRETVKGEIAT